MNLPLGFISLFRISFEIVLLSIFMFTGNACGDSSFFRVDYLAVIR
jgi:hypothetical protein